MVFLYLFFAHFLADFLLQPTWLVIWKNNSWKGVFVHASVHFVMALLLLGFYLQSIDALILATAIAFFHFFIDLTKAHHERSAKNFQFSYWIDQAFHYFSIILVGCLSLTLSSQPALLIAVQNWPIINLLLRPEVLIYFCLAIFSTLTIEYSVFQKTRIKKNFQYKIDHKSLIKRLLIASLIFLGILFASVNWLYPL
ncbi:MAG: DUF3307 domain-containing protein [Candidatus Altimarinota bacterium]